MDADRLLAVSRGASRTVLLVGPWAIKVPRLRAGWRAMLCGLLSNMAERERWRSGAHPSLCPILWSVPGGWLVVMPRVRVTTDFDPAAAAISGATGYDHKPCSYGYHRGELVAIDYHGPVWRELT